MPANKIYYVEVEERYLARVAISAECEYDAEARVNELINDGEIDPAKLVNESTEGSNYSREVISVEKAEGMPEDVMIYE